MKTIVLRALCWPLYFGTLVALVVHAAWGASKRWDDGVLVTTLAADSWPMQSWYRGWGGTCFGFGIMLAPDQSDVTVRHEHEHVEQMRAASIGGLMLGLVVLAITHSLLGVAALFACWLLTGAAVYVAGLLTAWLRGNDPYRGNYLERAAYDASGVQCRRP